MREFRVTIIIQVHFIYNNYKSYNISLLFNKNKIFFISFIFKSVLSSRIVLYFLSVILIFYNTSLRVWLYK
jgi:hypothetical protein